MSERERKAEEHIEQMRILPEITGEDARRESFKEGWDAAIEAAAKLVELRVEHLSNDPQCNGGYENLMRGMLLCKAEEIRSLGRGEQKAGGENEKA